MTTTTNDTRALTQKFIADMEARRAALLLIATTDSKGGWVIKCGPMCIRVAGERGERAEATSIERASRYADRANADRLAARITNGAGEQARVVRYQDAVADDLNMVTGSLDALRQAISREQSAAV